MNCASCQSLLEESAAFCGNCGQPVAAAAEKSPCPACGAVNEARAQFCAECGATLRREEDRKEGGALLGQAARAAGAGAAIGGAAMGLAAQLGGAGGEAATATGAVASVLPRRLARELGCPHGDRRGGLGGSHDDRRDRCGRRARCPTAGSASSMPSGAVGSTAPSGTAGPASSMPSGATGATAPSGTATGTSPATSTPAGTSAGPQPATVPTQAGPRPAPMARASQARPMVAFRPGRHPRLRAHPRAPARRPRMLGRGHRPQLRRKVVS